MYVGQRKDLRTFPGHLFRMPQDQRIFELQFWTMHKAAKEWGCSYQTARRWVLLHPEVAVLVRVWSPRAPVCRWRLCVFAGQKKFASSAGAEHFRSSSWQRSMAMRRWKREKGKELPTPNYGRCRQPIPGTNFPTSLPQLSKLQLAADHKPLSGQIGITEAMQHAADHPPKEQHRRWSPAQLEQMYKIISRPQRY